MSMGTEIRIAIIVPLVSSLVFTTFLWILLESAITQSSWAQLENLAMLRLRTMVSPQVSHTLPDTQGLDLAFSIVDHRGRVLASSARGLEMPSNLLEAQDLRAAFTGKNGRTRGYCPLVRHEAMTMALPLELHDGHVFTVLRAHSSTAPLQEQLIDLRRRLLAGLIVCTLLGTLLGEVLGRSITRPLHNLTQSLRKPEEAPPQSLAASLELYHLGLALQSMRAEISAQNQALNLQNQRLQVVLNKLDDGVLLVDPAGEIVFSNPAALRILDVSREDLQERSFESRDDTVSRLMALASKPTAPNQPLTLAGPERHLLVDVFPLTWISGLDPARVVVLRDVSSFVRADRMRQDFVANASHELRTPIAAVSLALEALEMGAMEDAEQRSMFLTRARRAADRLVRLANSLLHLSAAESTAPEGSGRGASCDACEIALQVVATHTARAHSLRKELRIRVPQQVVYVPMLSVDLVRVVDNLVDNALKYTLEGGLIEVILDLDEQNLELRVADNGPGIEAAHLGMIFERFYRANPSRSHEGVGLGLTLARLLVQRSGGTIRANNNPKGGACLIVTLPRMPPPTADPVEHEPSPKEASSLMPRKA